MAVFLAYAGMYAGFGVHIHIDNFNFKQARGVVQDKHIWRVTGFNGAPATQGTVS